MKRFAYLTLVLIAVLSLYTVNSKHTSKAEVVQNVSSEVNVLAVNNTDLDAIEEGMTFDKANTILNNSCILQDEIKIGNINQSKYSCENNIILVFQNNILTNKTVNNVA